MSKIKVAIVQIDYRPSFYIDDIDAIIEPFGNKDTSVSLLSFSGSERLKDNLKKEYISYTKLKVTCIIAKAKELNVDVILFPEYSIPPELLFDMVEFIKDSNIVVIAGTHIVTNKELRYPKGYPESKSVIGYAMCPVLSKDGIIDFTFKTHKAQPEICSLKTPKTMPNDVFDMGNFEIQIKICIDAIKGGNVFGFNQDKKGMLAIPSLSYTTDGFNAAAILSNLNEIPVLYSNFSTTGGSFISAAFSSMDKHWFVEDGKSIGLPKKVEAMVTATLDLEKMFCKKGSVDSESGAIIGEVVNIFYNKNDLNKKTIEMLNDSDFYDNDEKIKSLIEITECPLLSRKLQHIKRRKENGLLTKEYCNDVMQFIKINTLSFNDFSASQIDAILKKLAENYRYSSQDAYILKNIAVLSVHAENKTEKDINKNIYNDQKLFYGRDKERVRISEFIHSTEKVLLIYGLRGIGKTKLVKGIDSLISGDLWSTKYLAINKGVGYEYLFEEICSMFDLPYLEKKDFSTTELVTKIFEYIKGTTQTILTIDDIHNCTEANGRFIDKSLLEFVQAFISEVKKSKNIKLILVSNRKMIEIDAALSNKIEVSRLDELSVKAIIKYCYYAITGSNSFFDLDEQVYKVIYGNPLAAILAAQLLSEGKMKELTEDTNNADIFNHFQERMIINLLDKIDLTEEEKKVLQIISVTKGSVEVSFIKRFYPYLLSSIDRLINRFLIEKSDDIITIHPLFQEHYYSSFATYRV